MIYTLFKDRNDNKIYFRSFLKNSSGDLFLVEHDQKLSYILFNICSGTIEKLNEYNSAELKVIAEDTAVVASHL